ncbi:MAG: DUF971 domain-containing protein [candidate division KSB1 bacterium]|nr:DUF971 domain-containing protein [candidate division KSB1 bacterium]MDZ7275171.1 DUF971 domain-containing protein [candidate division KSB1 bacterium]MDZ7287340.1 DUF971 domain-containing protein [candidate division KSB1 bacterium]MDZ7299454.1 DUF971 domain-containing protein [candidate division KSB1 bacterium]MDZ7305500.1 DUF971 domain-containing protein [candidate division KSB1 bacterium]
MPTPLNIFPVDARTLGIDWDDGRRTTYSLRFLRGRCCCAACVDEVTGRRRVFPEDIPEDIRALEARPVGRYAVQFLWSDGHDSGIYTFDYLRGLEQKS